MMMLGAHQVTSAVDPSKTFLEDAIDTTNEDEGQEKEKTDWTTKIMSNFMCIFYFLVKEFRIIVRLCFVTFV